MEHRRTIRPGLLLTAALTPLAELAALWVTGLTGDRALALQVSAPAPLDVYHDLRWLMVLPDSWLAVALEGLAALLLRSLLDAVLIHQAWEGDDRPGLVTLWRRTGLATLVFAVVVIPWAALAFGVDVVSISWLTLAAVPPVMVLVLASAHGALRRGWWHQLPPRRAVGWVALTVAETTVAGGLLASAPAGWWVPIVVLGGAFNGWAWRGVVRAVVGHPAPVHGWRPGSPAIALGMAAVTVAGTSLAFALATSGSPASAAPPSPVAAVSGTGQPVIIVGGFDTAWNGDPAPPLTGDYAEERFSYRGLSATGRPLPYTADDTHQSIAVLARRLGTQVARLHAATGRPVSIVAESEGALVSRVYAAADPTAPVDQLLLLSPLDRPGGVYYPQAGQQGYGLLTGWELRGLTNLLGAVSPVHLPADNPFLRSIVDHAGALRNLLSCPAAGRDEHLIEPLADSVVDPSDPAPGIPTIVLPAFHGGLLGDATAQRDLGALLADQPAPVDDPTVAGFATALRRAASPWQVPTLPLSLYPRPSADHPSCAAMTRSVQSWVNG